MAKKTAIGLLVPGLLQLLLLVCAGCGRIAGRATERVAADAARQAERSGARILARDMARDEASRVIILHADKRVYKYITKSGEEKMLAKGIPAGSHFTYGISAGRPLSAAHARERYGLLTTPEKRISVTIPTGMKVRANKVVGGHAGGYGEIRIDQKLDASAIQKSNALPHP